MKNKSDSDLVLSTKQLVAEERRKTLEVLEHLQEIYMRRIHLSLGYSSLHEFLVKELSYSDGAAARRISAMHLVRELPEVKESVANGALSLSTASTVQVFFKAERIKSQKSYSREEKLALVKRVERTTKQECAAVLAQASPSYAAPGKEIKIPEDAELRDLMDEFRRLAMLADGSSTSIVKAALQTAIRSLKAAEASVRGAGPSAKNSRYIPKPMKREVWRRDQGRCAFVNPKTQLRCGATHKLEVDHIQPFVLDGVTNAQNLRLLCQAHNQFYAWEMFGERGPSSMPKEGGLSCPRADTSGACGR